MENIRRGPKNTEKKNRRLKDERTSDQDDSKSNPTIDRLSDDWLGNVKTFNEIIKDPYEVNEISGMMEKEYPGIYEYRKKLTKMVLRAFPDIERLFWDEDIEFHARILRVPFYSESGDLQHDCVQKYLAQTQGVINIATGLRKIISNLFYIDLPILAPKGRGEALLFEQKILLEKSIPSQQRDCLVKAQPIAMTHKVYDYPGRWIIWRMVFDLDKAESIGRYAKTSDTVVPLYVQRLADFRLGGLFPFAGTTDGELSLFVIEKNEEDLFRDDLLRMKEEFGLETKYIDAEVRISWESIVDLGILPYAAEPHLPQIGSIFSQKLKKMILEDAVIDFGSFTEKSNVSNQKHKNRRTRELFELMAYDIMHRRLESVFHVVQKVPESLMKSYEVRGRGEIK